MREIFTEIYKTNYWKNGESRSGHGSDMESTKVIRRELLKLIKQLEIKSMLDIPCGDFYWMKAMDLPVRYLGADIVPELVEYNRGLVRGGSHQLYQFEVLDVTTDKLPKSDLVLVRDLLGHFSRKDVKKALANLRASGSKYLLATTFPEHENNGDIKTGEWRPINLASMFGLPDPILVINEGCTAAGGKFKDKSLGLWRLDDE